MDARSHLQAGALRERQLIGQERPLGVDDVSSRQADLVLDLSQRV